MQIFLFKLIWKSSCFEDLIQKHARSRSGAPAAGVGSQALLEPGGLVVIAQLTQKIIENFGAKMLQF